MPPACPDNSYPAISPDGTQIAFVRAFGRITHDQIDHVGIYRMRLDGTGVHRVSLPPTRTAEDVEPQWSPDGRQVVFVRHNVTARPRNKQAVMVAGWVTLICGFALWPLALIWAYVDVPSSHAKE